MVTNFGGVMVVMSSFHAHNYFLLVLIVNTKVLLMSLNLLFRSLIIFTIDIDVYITVEMSLSSASISTTRRISCVSMER